MDFIKYVKIKQQIHELRKAGDLLMLTNNVYTRILKKRDSHAHMSHIFKNIMAYSFEDVALSCTFLVNFLPKLCVLIQISRVK